MTRASLKASSRPTVPVRPSKRDEGPKRAAGEAAKEAAPIIDDKHGLGDRLRHLREAYGLSVRELARRSGLAHGTIGGIEKDAISPSVGSLRKILDSFPMTLSEFFSLDLEADTQVFFTRDELLEVGGNGVSLKQVGRNLKARPLQVLLEHYRPGAETASLPYNHVGEEGGIVVQGRIELTVGKHTRLLGPGDGYLFSSRLPHRFSNPGPEECVIVSAMTPPV